jgi:hypothetical protein
MIPQVIKDIIANQGYMTAAQLTVLAVEAPEVPVVIKCNMGRHVRMAAVAKHSIDLIGSDPDDYVREVFFSCGTWDIWKAKIDGEAVCV